MTYETQKYQPEQDVSMFLRNFGFGFALYGTVLPGLLPQNSSQSDARPLLPRGGSQKASSFAWLVIAWTLVPWFAHWKHHHATHAIKDVIMFVHVKGRKDRTDKIDYWIV